MSDITATGESTTDIDVAVAMVVAPEGLRFLRVGKSQLQDGS